MVRRHRFMALLAGATLIGSGLVVTAPAYAGTASATQASAAPGAPGAASYFDLARKDCVGTAADRGSKVWYTVAGGVLSDVYEPTIDNTDVSTLQYVVTDGSTFTDLQTRDMTYTVAADRSGMACTVTSTDAKHGFRLVTTYITDPARDTVLMQTKLEAPAGRQPQEPAPVRAARRPRQRQRREAGPRTPARTPAWWTPAPAHPSR